MSWVGKFCPKQRYSLALSALLVLCACGWTGCATTNSGRVVPAVVATSSTARSAAGVSPIVANLAGPAEGDEDDDDSPRNHTTDNRYDNDADFDNDYKKEKGGYYDSDDALVRDFGHPASAADKRMIAVLVKRYYAAAAAQNSAYVCGLLYSLLEEALVEDYGEGAGPPYLRGKTCIEVMSKFLAHFHEQMTAKTKIAAVRVKEKRGYVLLASTDQPARYLMLRLERGRWKVNSLATLPLP